jgi:hypothetical protein
MFLEEGEENKFRLHTNVVVVVRSDPNSRNVEDRMNQNSRLGKKRKRFSNQMRLIEIYTIFIIMSFFIRIFRGLTRNRDGNFE